VIADPLAALLPGLTGAFEHLDILQAEDMYRALRLHEERLVQRTQALSFITALPCAEPRAALHSAHAAAPHPAQASSATVAMPPPVPAPKPVSRATHLLCQHVAKPLQATGTALADGWELYRDSDGWRLRGAGASAAVNGRPYQSGQVLACGDAIAIGTAAAGTLIEVSS
jgi:hypothetical protein